MDLVLDLVFFRVLIWHIVLGHARLTHHVLYEYETYHRCSLLRPSLSLSTSLPRSFHQLLSCDGGTSPVS